MSIHEKPPTSTRLPLAESSANIGLQRPSIQLPHEQNLDLKRTFDKCTPEDPLFVHGPLGSGHKGKGKSRSEYADNAGQYGYGGSYRGSKRRKVDGDNSNDQNGPLRSGDGPGDRDNTPTALPEKVTDAPLRPETPYVLDYLWTCVSE